jgi:hypothetical protein
MRSATKRLYPNNRTDPLSDLRMLAERYPEAVHGDAHELAQILGCSEFEAEEAQRWMLEDGLEVRA